MNDMIGIAFLILGNMLIAGFWVWVCFLGGDSKWCGQIKGLWRGGAYTRLQPWHCKVLSTVFLLALVAGDVAIILSKSK